MAAHFKKNDCVQVQDGKRIRVGFVRDFIPAGNDKPERYVIAYREAETGKISATEWTVTDVAKGETPKFLFNEGDKVLVDVGRKTPISGVITGRKEITPDNLEAIYGVMFKDAVSGLTDMAWWTESALSAA